MGETTYNITTKFSETGANTVVRSARTINKELGLMVTKKDILNKQTGMWRTQSVNVRQYAKNTTKAAVAARKMGGSLKGLATRFVGLQAALMFAMQKGRELIKWVQESIKSFREFETNMAEVSTLMTGDMSSSIYSLTAGVEEMSMAFGKSTKDVSRGLYDVISAAFLARDAMSLLRVATEASIAGLSSVEVSVDAITSVLNSYGKSAYEATHVSDIMFQTVKRGKLIYEDLASAMGYITPIAANLGVEFEEIAAALATVTRQGQHVDMATRGLALGLQNISDLTPKAAAAALKYDVNLSSVALSVGGLDYVLKELNKAMGEHGSKILPEMISNMRSLRVFMALAGDEGIAGFTKDLNLMEQSAGASEAALSKMMITSQRQADMLDMSMKNLERDIGSAWSSFDLWWKKTSLWWGTFLSGGDASAAVDKHSEYISKIESNYARIILSEDRTSKAAADLYSSLMKYEDVVDLFDRLPSSIANIGKNLGFGGVGGINAVIERTVNWGDAIGYVNETLNQQDLEGEAEKLEQLGMGLRAVFSGDNESALAFARLFEVDWSDILKLDEIMKTDLYKASSEDKAFIQSFFSQFDELLNISIPGESSVWDRIRAGLSLGETEEDAFKWEDLFGTFDEAGKIGGSIGIAIDDIKTKVADSQADIDIYSDSWDELVGTFDSLIDDLQNTETNILELTYTLDEMDVKLHDIYETMAGGEGFEGEYRWQLAVEATKTALDRFQHYSQMAIKYGDDMRTGFMSGMSGVMSDAGIDMPELDWINADVFSNIDTSAFESMMGGDLSQYGTTMEAIIGVMGDYTQAKEEVSEAETAYNAILKELNKENLVLSLEQQKIQLMGMLRRRGNTRSEEKKLKAIEIEKTENKIEQMEAQQEYQAVADAEMIDELEDTYELASDIYEEYVDRVKLYLWELQDARDTELNNFANTILQQERYFNLYTEWLQDAEDHAALLNLQIIALAAAIDANMEEQWEEFFGKTASEMALQALKDINAEIDKIKDATGDEDDDDGDSGGVDDDVPEPPKDIVKTVAEHAAMLVSQGNGTGYYKVKIISSSGAFRAKGNAPFTDERSKAAAKAGVLGYAKDFYPIGKEIGWQRGTHYVPETQPYMLHRGETVSPAGQSGGSSSDVVYITINNNNAINSELDAERFAKIQAETIRQRLSDETGKTRYRLR